MSRGGVPETYRLLTPRGELHIDDVVVGDYTIDANGKWVEVEHIHRHERSEVAHWHLPRKTQDQAPEFSPEFQCVQGQTFLHSLYKNNRKPKFTLEPHDPERPITHSYPDRYGKKIVFVPNTGKWAARGLSEIVAKTPREKTAALVAMMESSNDLCRFDWRQSLLTIHEDPRHSAIADELLGLIPEQTIVQREQSYMTWDGRKHRLTIDPRKAEGLPGGDMLEWVRGLSQSEVKAFFNTYWFLNGETRHETRDYPYRAKLPVRNYQSNRLQAIQLAAFRCGSLGRPVRTKGNKEEIKIGLVEGKAAAHKYALKDTYRADTWGVQTESGSMSVWAPVNSREHAYIILGHERL